MLGLRRLVGVEEEEAHRMTIFPAGILFASDGSEDSELAATTAVALAKVTGSELHVLHVAPAFPDYFEPSDPDPSAHRERGPKDPRRAAQQDRERGGHRRPKPP